MPPIPTGSASAPGPTLPSRLPWARRWKWILLLVGSAAPIAALAAYGGISRDEFASGALIPVTVACGAFFGAWTNTTPDGFAAGLLAGWGGFLVGTFVGILVQYAVNPTLGWAGWIVVAPAGLVGAAAFGLLYGILAGVGGAVAARVKRLVARPRVSSPPVA